MSFSCPFRAHFRQHERPDFHHLQDPGVRWPVPPVGGSRVARVSQAGGFRLEGPSTGFPGSTFTNQGNEIGGHIAVEGPTFNGSASGAFTPQGVLVGHFEGVSADFFGTDDPCSGVCG